MTKDMRLVVCMIVIILLVLLCLFNCTAEKEDEDGNNQNLNATATVAPTRIISIPGNNELENMPDISLVTIEYYTITGAGGTRIDTAETLVEEHVIITPELIIDYCLDSFMDEDIELNVLHVNTTDGMCTIDFDDSIHNLAQESRVTEVCALDALAMSLIDNCDDVVSVTFTINSEAYVTDNMKIGIGSPYLSR